MKGNLVKNQRVSKYYEKDCRTVTFCYTSLWSYFLKDLDIARYADDTTIHTVKEKKESGINRLETSSHHQMVQHQL